MNISRKFQLILVVIALAFATAFAYWPVHQNGFIRFDDDLYVTGNYVVQQGLTQEGIAWAFSTTEGGNWHPLTWLSHMLDFQFFGMNAGAHHLVSLAFHLGNTLLLFLLLRKLTGTLWRSAFVAALFALHPLHVESVAWIAERKDVLSGFFFLLTIWAYSRYAGTRSGQWRKPKNEQSGMSHSLAFPRSHSLIFYTLALVFFVLGLMSKPMLVTLPFVLLLLDFWPLGRMEWSQPSEIRNSKFVILEKTPFFALAAVSSVLTFFAQKNAGGMASLQQMVLSHRIGNAFVAYVGYLGKMIWPRDLAVLYPVQVWPIWIIVCSAVLLLFLSAAAFKLARRRPYFLVGWLWYVGMLVPVIGLIHVGSQWMADRYTYLPLIGIFMILVWGGHELLRSRKTRTLSGLLVLSLAFILTRQRVMLWRDSETLFKQALQSTKDNLLIQGTMAAELVAQNRLDEAVVLLKESLRLRPDSASSLRNMGSALERQGNFERAIEYYEQSLAINPKISEAQNNLGYLLLVRGRLEEALPHFLAALKVRPQFPEAHYNLGNIYFLQNDFSNAFLHYNAAVHYRPDYAEARSNLGYTLLKLGNPGEAIPHLEAAVRLKPDCAQAHNNLAETLSHLHRFAEAEMHSIRAVQLQPDSAAFQDTFGLTLAAQKKWPEASAAFSSALQIKPSAEFHFHLANALLAQGKLREAKNHYSSALELQAQYPEAEMQLAMLFLREKNDVEAVAHLEKVVAQRPEWIEALNNLAWILATHRDPDVRNGPQAVQFARRACESGPPEPRLLDTLAAAYAEAGRFADAIATLKKAISLSEAAQQTNAVATFRTRLVLYEKNQPFHEFL